MKIRTHATEGDFHVAGGGVFPESAISPSDNVYAYFAIMVAERYLSRIAGTSSGRELKA